MFVIKERLYAHPVEYIYLAPELNLIIGTRTRKEVCVYVCRVEIERHIQEWPYFKR